VRRLSAAAFCRKCRGRKDSLFQSRSAAFSAVATALPAQAFPTQLAGRRLPRRRSPSLRASLRESNDGIYSGAILYIHVPKSSGNAITNFFERNQFEVAFCDVFSTPRGLNALRACSAQHDHGELVAKTLRLVIIYVRSMTVRNPMDRLKSEFLWRVCDPAADPNRWAQQTLHSYNDGPFVRDNHMQLRRSSCRSGSGLRSHV
jgi:hypothetical protein